jgi:protein phosphatase
MGGGQDGEAIAELAVAAVADSLAVAEARFPDVVMAIDQASRRVWESHQSDGGTTLIACRAADGRLWFASVGDSVLFLRRGERLFELNRRHEHRFDLWRQALNGVMTVADAEADPQADALASYVGCEELSVDWTRRPLALEADDVLLACSDGVSDTLSHDEIRALLGLEPGLAADAIERRIKAAGFIHQDNYTAIVVRHYPGGGPEEGALPAARVGGKVPVLCGTAGEYLGAEIMLAHRVVLGRDPAQCHVAYGPSVPGISALHCTVTWNPVTRRFTVEDHGSSRGTFLASGQRLVPGEPAQLDAGHGFYLDDRGNSFSVRLA